VIPFSIKAHFAGIVTVYKYLYENVLKEMTRGVLVDPVASEIEKEITSIDQE
jgi:hypothetical protein